MPLSAAFAQAAGAPRPAPAQQVYGPTPDESSPPRWPQPVRAAPHAPNILLILTDDVGFGASSTFGGPIPTSTFDGLAREGLRYTRFNTTAICSPTRASLLTGRDPQAVGMGYVTNWATGYDGYNSVIPRSAATIPQLMKAHGYNTAMFGKGHITPEWEMSQAGPFDRWPTGLGFEYFYGFLGADTDQFAPSLVENTRPIPTPDRPGYALDTDLADHAIRWIAEQKATAPDKPFFIYYASGAAHAPNQAPQAWLDRFRGRFDAGWDVMRADTIARQRTLGLLPPGTDESPRPATLPLWSSLSVDQKRLYARYMEAYAAELAYSDHEIGRVIQSLRDARLLDDTIVIYVMGDNGGSAEGSFDGKLYEQSALSGVKEDPAYVLAHIGDIGTGAAYNLYPGGWGWALNAPFQWAKRYASHFGGTRNGMVVSWPGHMTAPGGIRTQFLHVSDIMPTLLDIAGVEPPAIFDGVPQKPITGIDFRFTFTDAAAPSRHTSQAFGIAQNLAYYKDGWLAATTPMVTPWERVPPAPVAIDDRRWELYHVDTDYSEAHDLALADPARLAAMKAMFWAQASLAGILPIQASEGHQQGRPDLNEGRTSFVYGGPVSQIPASAAPPTVGRSFTISATVEVPAGGGQGVLAAEGGRFGGYSFFLNGGRPAFTFNLTPAHVTRIVADRPLTAGRHVLGLRFRLDREAPVSGGTVTLSADGHDVAQGRVERTFPLVISHTEGFDIGQDGITPVDADYTVATSAFTGEIDTLTVTLSGAAAIRPSPAAAD